MSCLSNLTIKNPKDNSYIPVSCGHCLPCRMKRAIDWRVRIAMERYTQRNFGSAFATLTYSDTYLPDDYSVCISELQKCIKRIRYYAHKRDNYISPNFKYFGVSEYGDESGRPHYHLIVTGINPNTLGSILRESWKNGFVQSGVLSPYRIQYVVDYVTIYDPTPEVKDSYRLEGLEPPQDIFSNGIGADYMWKYRDEAIERGYYLFANKKWIPPAYWRDKLGIDINPFQAALSRIDMLKQYKFDINPVDNKRLEEELAYISNRSNQAYGKKSFKIIKSAHKTKESDVSDLVSYFCF